MTTHDFVCLLTIAACIDRFDDDLLGCHEWQLRVHTLPDSGWMHLEP